MLFANPVLKLHLIDLGDMAAAYMSLIFSEVSMAPQASASHPALGYIALAPCVSLFALDHNHLLPVPPALLGSILLLGGVLMVFSGVHAQQRRDNSTAVRFVPLGLFWFSMIGFYILPKLAIGSAPAPLSLLIYLTFWGLFAALLFLGSFAGNLAVQLTFCALMINLLAMASGEIRSNPFFADLAAIAGTLAGLAALYTAAANLRCRWQERSLTLLSTKNKAGSSVSH